MFNRKSESNRILTMFIKIQICTNIYQLFLFILGLDVYADYVYEDFYVLCVFMSSLK